jgi:hypothetical protein
MRFAELGALMRLVRRMRGTRLWVRGALLGVVGIGGGRLRRAQLGMLVAVLGAVGGLFSRLVGAPLGVVAALVGLAPVAGRCLVRTCIGMGRAERQPLLLVLDFGR